LFVWPGERSYTRQPSAEFHTLGSPPVVSAVLGQLCRRGARPARPGEFTLRAFLAGRIDLVQAEAVLGVVEARDGRELGGALEQLAGGLSRPLNWLREQLLGLLAELEAGLDFADEHIEFISPEEVRARLDEGRRVVAGGLAQISSRDRRSELQRVVITGPPNVGKSLLFNALVERYGAAAGESAIVSATPGSTRDYLKTPLELSGVACELVDAAGQIEAATAEVDLVTQQMAAAQRARSNLELRCVEAPSATAETIAQAHREIQGDGFVVVTKVDLAEPRHVAAGAVPCSSATGRGIDQLAAVVRRKLEAACQERAGAGYAAATASRCLASLEEADRALRAASELAGMAGDELVAAEVRVALAALGNVVGHVAADDVLDRIFSQFCIGK
jgi:tRNA modification GTPase